jgi:hypothetical protein
MDSTGLFSVLGVSSDEGSATRRRNGSKANDK